MDHPSIINRQMDTEGMACIHRGILSSFKKGFIYESRIELENTAKWIYQASTERSRAVLTHSIGNKVTGVELNGGNRKMTSRIMKFHAVLKILFEIYDIVDKSVSYISKL